MLEYADTVYFADICGNWLLISSISRTSHHLDILSSLDNFLTMEKRTLKRIIILRQM